MTGPAIHDVRVASPEPGRLMDWYDEVFGRGRSGLRIEPGRIYPRRSREPARLVPTVAVTDMAEVERRLIGAGATWLREVEGTWWGRIATVLDPDANEVQIIETRRGR